MKPMMELEQKPVVVERADGQFEVGGILLNLSYPISLPIQHFIHSSDRKTKIEFSGPLEGPSSGTDCARHPFCGGISARK